MFMLKKFNTVKRFLKIIFLEIRDLHDRVSGKRKSHIPPTRLMFDGPASLDGFLKSGDVFMSSFVQILHPEPSIRVLDIGSGIGRHTLPLTKMIDSHGRYDGIEIVIAGVKWCRKHISNRFPNFRFQHVDIYNGAYNPRGKILPEEFVFPFEDNSFDVVMALSVFTHMTPDSVKNYLKESYRVLKPGGKAYFTYFLINDDSNKRLRNKNNTQPFEQTLDGYWTTNHQIPEAAIAYDEDVIRRFYSDSNLKINKIYYGSWCGRKKFTDYQDIVLASKK